MSNKDLWESLSQVVASRKEKGQIFWKYVRGHTGNPGNERCDAIAVKMAAGEWVSLYKGSLLQYDIPILDLPPDVELPEMKPKQEKTKAFSYLSYVSGVVTRHKDWPSCDRRVKGRSGAKFKKASSSSEEPEILKTWGLDPNKIKIESE